MKNIVRSKSEHEDMNGRQPSTVKVNRSGKIEFNDLKYPVPVLKAGVIYSGDNGRLVCCKCAGQSALYTGHDLSGLEMTPCSKLYNNMWRQLVDKDIACEAGCTTYHPDHEDTVSKMRQRIQNRRKRNTS